VDQPQKLLGGFTMENLKAKLQEIITLKEAKLAQLEATTPESIDCPITEEEINDAKRAVEIIDSEEAFDDKANKLDHEIMSFTTSASIYDAIHEYLDSVVIVETYGTYIEEGDVQYIKCVAVDRGWFEGYCQDKWDSAVAEFLVDYTWDHTEAIDELAREESGLVSVWER
jgi:hypothetical protein